MQPTARVSVRTGATVLLVVVALTAGWLRWGTLTGTGARVIPDGPVSAHVPGSWSWVETLIARGSSTPALWLEPHEIASLPVSGRAWDDVRRRADGDWGAPEIGDLSNRHHVDLLAGALVAARLDDDSYRARVRDGLRLVLWSAPDTTVSILGPARKLVAYVIAADLIDLASFDPAFDGIFRRWLAEVRHVVYDDADDPAHSILTAHETRPNNFGTAAGASRIAIAAYLGDRADLEAAARVFRGWLGDRSAYTGFEYGSLDWQADERAPVGINPVGARKRIHGQERNLDGVLPDDQRRQGDVTWPPQREPYVYAALQGAVLQAELLDRQGFPAYRWGDEAIRRAFQWLYTAQFAPDGGAYPAPTGSHWIVPVVNRAYGTTYPWNYTDHRGHGMGYTNWTHG